jgi:hypothetical protein
MNEWMNESMNEWINQSIIQSMMTLNKVINAFLQWLTLYMLICIVKVNEKLKYFRNIKSSEIKGKFKQDVIVIQSDITRA